MSRSIGMVKGIRKLMSVCANVRQGEKVLILTDAGVTIDTGQPVSRVAELFAMVASEMGAVPYVLKTPEPPAPGSTIYTTDIVAGAMKEADVIFEVTSKEICHSRARHEACKAGARYLVVATGFSERLLTGPGGIDADFHATKAMIEKLVEVGNSAKSVRVTAPGGTDFSGNLERGRARGLHGLVHEPGSYGAPPDLEFSVTPVAGTVQGVVVIDGYIDGIDPVYGLVRDPVKITLEEGRATRIDGGIEARLLKEMLDSFEDPSVYDLAEIGFGMNPQARITRDLLESEGAYGTAHIALGHTIIPERMEARRRRCHVDMVYRKPTLKLDERIVIEKGEVISQLR